VVGDASHDLSMGRAAGVGLTVGVLGGTSGAKDLEPYADRIIEHLVDLLSLAEFRTGTPTGRG
jgi:phosphoglycolate phosphatase